MLQHEQATIAISKEIIFSAQQEQLFNELVSQHMYKLYHIAGDNFISMDQLVYSIVNDSIIKIQEIFPSLEMTNQNIPKLIYKIFKAFTMTITFAANFEVQPKHKIHSCFNKDTSREKIVSIRNLNITGHFTTQSELFLNLVIDQLLKQPCWEMNLKDLANAIAILLIEDKELTQKINLILYKIIKKDKFNNQKIMLGDLKRFLLKFDWCLQLVKHKNDIYFKLKYMPTIQQPISLLPTILYGKLNNRTNQKPTNSDFNMELFLEKNLPAATTTTDHLKFRFFI